MTCSVIYADNAPHCLYKVYPKISRALVEIESSLFYVSLRYHDHHGRCHVGHFSTTITKPFWDLYILPENVNIKPLLFAIFPTDVGNLKLANLKPTFALRDIFYNYTIVSCQFKGYTTTHRTYLSKCSILSILFQISFSTINIILTLYLDKLYVIWTLSF